MKIWTHLRKSRRTKIVESFQLRMSQHNAEARFFSDGFRSPSPLPVSARHKAPSGQIWAHFRHWTCWIKPGFGPKFISGNFIEISTNSSDSMLPWKNVCAYFPTAASSAVPGKDFLSSPEVEGNLSFDQKSWLGNSPE